LLYSGFAVVIYILPGLGVLSWLWRGRSRSAGEWIGLSVSVSLALYPVLTLWCFLMGVRPGFAAAWVLGLVLLAVRLWQHKGVWRSWRRVFSQWRNPEYFPGYTYFTLLVLLIITRLLPVRSMVAPAWGDSVHHTLIVQLMLEHGGLFQSWAPYAPLQSFTYHFGYHAAIANWSWVSGMDAAQAVLIGSQMLNVSAVLALYPLAVRLAGGNQWAGVTAVLVAGLLVQMPAFYVNWGRYTQLAGQAILPALCWSFDLWWGEKNRPPRRMLLLIALLAAGLALTHYRIAALAATAGVAWALWALWAFRRTLSEWMHRMFAITGAVAGVAGIIAPWVYIVQTSQLAMVAGAIAQQGVNPESAGSDLIAWGSVGAYYTRALWIGCVVAILYALWRHSKLAICLGFWAIFAFLVANPFLLNLPGSGLVNNFTLVIGAYIHLALVIGWFAGLVWNYLASKISGVFVMGVLCLAAAYGVPAQLRIVEPFFQMVTPADQEAFTWISHYTPADARFLVNGFLAFADSTLVGSDAGWWLPYYTHRENTVPPILYTVEQLAPGVDPQQFRQLAIDIRSSNGDAERLHDVFCRANITHVYIGDRVGEVGFGATPLIQEGWFTDTITSTLVYQEGNVEVWEYDRTAC
jgi:hypothetical protein